jgi:hypothetical protein
VCVAKDAVDVAVLLLLVVVVSVEVGVMVDDDDELLSTLKESFKSSPSLCNSQQAFW